MPKNVTPLHAIGTETDPAAAEPKTPAPDAPPDPFDAKSLALPPDFHAAGGAANPRPKNVQVRKPHNQEWIRVHPDPDFHGDFGTIFLRDDREFYLLTPTIAQQMKGNRHLKTVTIYTAYSRLSGLSFGRSTLSGSPVKTSGQRIGIAPRMRRPRKRCGSCSTSTPTWAAAATSGCRPTTRKPTRRRSGRSSRSTNCYKSHFSATGCSSTVSTMTFSESCGRSFKGGSLVFHRHRGRRFRV